MKNVSMAPSFALPFTVSKGRPERFEIALQSMLIPGTTPFLSYSSNHFLNVHDADFIRPSSLIVRITRFPESSSQKFGETPDKVAYNLAFTAHLLYWHNYARDVVIRFQQPNNISKWDVYLVFRNRGLILCCWREMVENLSKPQYKFTTRNLY